MDAFSFATQLNANEMKIIQISTSLNFWFRNRDVTCNNIKLLHQIYLKQNCLRNLILSFSVYKRWKFYHFWWNVRESVCLKKWIFPFCWYDSSNCLIRNSYLDIVMCAKCHSTNVYIYLTRELILLFGINIYFKKTASNLRNPLFMHAKHHKCFKSN